MYKLLLHKSFCPFLVSSTNETACHNILEILLKVALNTITLTAILYGEECYPD
jgi:hypothetical protein